MPYSDWAVPLMKFGSIGAAVVATPAIIMGFRERAREMEEARRTSPSRSLLRRERPRAKPRAPAKR
jgi:hypothetical protein